MLQEGEGELALRVSIFNYYSLYTLLPYFQLSFLYDGSSLGVAMSFQHVLTNHQDDQDVAKLST